MASGRWAMLIPLVAVLAGCAGIGTAPAPAPPPPSVATVSQAPPRALRPGAPGMDFPAPQCGSPLPQARDFAIIGVTAKLPTEPNTCFDPQPTWAGHFTTPPMFYINAA